MINHNKRNVVIMPFNCFTLVFINSQDTIDKEANKKKNKAFLE